MELVIQYVVAITNMNAIMNFFIYTMRHDDMKQAIKCVFSCRRFLPAATGREIGRSTVFSGALSIPVSKPQPSNVNCPGYTSDGIWVGLPSD